LTPQEAKLIVAQAMLKGWARKPVSQLSPAQVERMKRNVREDRKPRELVQRTLTR
jgi:DNA replication protein DnaD